MDQQSRLVVFIIGAIVILYASMYFMPQPPEAPKASVPAAATPEKSKVPGAASAIKAAAPEKVVRQKKTAEAPAQTLTVETDQYIATFSNQGALLTGFELKKFLNRQTKKFIQLVNRDSDHPKPFTLDYAPLPDVNQRVFEVEGANVKLSRPGEKAKFSFRYVDANGTVLEKSFEFQNGSYLIPFGVSVSHTGKSVVPAANLSVEWADTLGAEENTGTSSRVQGYRVATLTGDRVSSESPKKSQESVEIPSPIGWTALADQFFAAALIPDASTGGASARVLRDYNAYNSPTPEDPNPGVNLKLFSPRPFLVFKGQELKGGESFQRKGQVFFGPQDYSILKGLHLQLEGLIDFGMFGFISVYMLELLKWFFTLVHNWGLAIVLLSIAVKLALWLPTHNSYKNMYLTQQKMKDIQPKLEAIKRKYAEDKQEQQKQTMALYQSAGINPMGGCLPMLLQMPVFLALYSTLSHSIELRSAPFLWLSDLTLKDPIFVLPLLMGASMVIQQKVSGQMSSQAAGQQKVMMWMMPVMLTFFSFQWPAGLLVYWVVTNVLSMLQQKVVNREIQNAKKKDEVVKS